MRWVANANPISSGIWALQGARRRVLGGRGKEPGTRGLGKDVGKAGKWVPGQLETASVFSDLAKLQYRPRGAYFRAGPVLANLKQYHGPILCSHNLKSKINTTLIWRNRKKKKKLYLI